MLQHAKYIEELEWFCQTFPVTVKQINTPIEAPLKANTWRAANSVSVTGASFQDGIKVGYKDNRNTI